MTKKKPTEGRYSTLELNLHRLRVIAAELEDGELSAGAREFLCTTLKRIGNGEDANAVLGVKAKRGERKTRESAEKAWRIIPVMGWIAAVTQPQEEGVEGMSLDDAFEEAAGLFHYSAESLRTYWANHPESRDPEFAVPIHVMPTRRPKGEEPKS